MRVFFKVRNFETTQHYKDRNPPWIKFHNNLLENYEFSQLSDTGKAHLLLIWLLASRMGNKLPFDPKWVGAKIQANSPVDLEELLAVGFIEQATEGNHTPIQEEVVVEPTNTLPKTGNCNVSEQTKAPQSDASNLLQTFNDDASKLLDQRERERQRERRGETERSVGPKAQRSKISDEEFLQGLKANPAYKHVDLEVELGKMDAWLQTPRGKRRQKTRAFILNWLNRTDRVVITGPPVGQNDPDPYESVYET